jgi:hypothetical protein
VQRPSRKRGYGLWLGACLALPAFGASPAVLPEGPEKPWITLYCARCHETAWIGQAGGTEDGWAARIRRMVRRGAVIPPERVAPLARYLAAALPARVRAEQLATSPINVTVSPVEMRPLQVWVRASGRQDAVTGYVIARVPSVQARLLKVGQRVRAFQLRSRASMYQGRVVSAAGNNVSIQLRSSGAPESAYLLEIIADLGPHLSIPNEAVIEEGDRQLVYVRHASGDLVPRTIRTGQRGELFVEVIEGLKDDEQVVTFGSFFIDAEFRMKGLAGM